MATTRLFQTILQYPGGAPIVGKQVSIRLNSPAINGDHAEVLRTLTVWTAKATDPTPGLVSTPLQPNAEILIPAGTSYSINVNPGVTWYFQIPTRGSTGTVIWLDDSDCYLDGPTNPAFAGGVTMAQLEAYVSGTYLPLPTDGIPATGAYPIVASAGPPIVWTWSAFASAGGLATSPGLATSTSLPTSAGASGSPLASSPSLASSTSLATAA